MTLSPSEDELKVALQHLRKENPSLGISKIHALLVSAHPEWTVSEKRARKILQAEGLVIGPPKSRQKNEGDSELQRDKKDHSDGNIYPSSRIIEDLDTKHWTSKVQVKFFGKIKGKGLVAVEQIKEGEVVWKEDPWIIAPEWSIYDLQIQSRACAYCTTPLTESSLVVACPASSSVSNGTHCTARFCTRLCLSRSSKVHPLLCPSQNPASIQLLQYARTVEWMACAASAECIARILLSNEKGKDELEKDWKFFSALAEIGMEDRFKQAGTVASIGPNRDQWKKAYKLMLNAFREPESILEKKKLSRILSKPLPEDIAKQLFDYEAYLHCLGRMSLNLEAHGGLYTLHSHLNHYCTPNISIRHLDKSKALSRITVIAKSDISPGEELVITYVNPEMGVNERRRELLSWGFGTCMCKRCVEDETALKEKITDGEEKDITVDLDLEDELRAGFGIV